MTVIKILIVALFLFVACKKSPHENPQQGIDEKIIDIIDSTTVENDSITNPIENETETDTLSVNNYLLYIGTYTDGTSKGIYLSDFDMQTGEISTSRLSTTLTNPSYQCITPDKKFLWSVSEDWGGPGKVLNYSIDSQSGKLTQISNFSSQGNGPCFVAYHEKTSNALLANYNTGNVANIPVDETGKGAGVIFTDQHKGSGPNKNRQNEPHAHCIKSDIDGKYIYSANLGTDKIYVYTLLNKQLNRVSEIEISPGSGPRHIDFHPLRKAMVVINELNSTVSIYTPDKEGIFNQPLEVKTTLPNDFNANNQCADIHYSPDGKYLYASNRGHNSIAVYKVDEQTMKIEMIELLTDNINWPRNFIITPNGNYLIVANQNSNSINVFKRDSITGRLSDTGHKQSISKPVCLTLFNLNQ